MPAGAGGYEPDLIRRIKDVGGFRGPLGRPRLQGDWPAAYLAASRAVAERRSPGTTLGRRPRCGRSVASTDDPPTETVYLRFTELEAVDRVAAVVQD